MKKRIIKITSIAITVILLASGWVHFAVIYNNRNTSNISCDSQVENILRGILVNNAEISDGEDCSITYDFECSQFTELREKYSLKEMAGDGNEFDKSKRLTAMFAPRLAHGGSYLEDGIAYNSLDLMAYSLDKSEHTINCRCKAQIFGEMCLSLGIYARKMWIMPYSEYDDECHVVTEIYDTGYSKWIMIDFTNMMYFTDNVGIPLSMTEIRNALITDKKIKYIRIVKNGLTEEISGRNRTSNYIYYLKNSSYMYYLANNTFGETNTQPHQFLLPANYSEHFREYAVGDGVIVNEKSINAAPHV